MQQRNKKRKSRYGIWFDNKFTKDIKSIRKKNGGRIKPKVKRCRNCGKRVKYHHIYCQKCWEKFNASE